MYMLVVKKCAPQPRPPPVNDEKEQLLHVDGQNDEQPQQPQQP